MSIRTMALHALPCAVPVHSYCLFTTTALADDPCLSLGAL